MMLLKWNAQLYDQQHDFVAAYGKGLLTFIPQQPNQAILDLGCGTGGLTAQLTQLGHRVLGIDSSASMIAEAKRTHPKAEYQVQNALKMAYQNEWDVVFSNAVFHWIPNHQLLMNQIARALKPNGVLVCEFGAAGNIATIERGFDASLQRVGGRYQSRFNFATAEAFGNEVEHAGMTIEQVETYDRPTPLKGGEAGLANWARQFFASDLAHYNNQQQTEILTAMADYVRPTLWDGQQWVADYRRLRCVAHR